MAEWYDQNTGDSGQVSSRDVVLSAFGNPKARAAITAKVQSQKAANDPFARANAQYLINDPALMAALRRGAIRRSAARRRSGSVLSRLAGLDPMTARYAQVDTEGRASGDLSASLGNAQLEQLMGGQQFKRGLFNQQLNFEQQVKMARLEAQLERENRPGLGQQFLGAVGGAAGSYLGGRVARPQGGGGGGGGRRQSQSWDDQSWLDN